MRTEQEYFSDAESIERCCVCGERLYCCDGIYYNTSTEECYCLDDCIIIALGVENSEEELEPCQCNYCKAEITEDFESVICDGERFCEENCAFKYYGIERMEL